MRGWWLAFAQAVTVTLGALFVVSLVAPGWLPWRTLANVSPQEVPTQPGSTAAALSITFRDAAGKAVGSVVNISATRQVRRPTPFSDDPQWRRFFGDRGLPETQLSLGSGVIVSREGYILTNAHVVDGVDEIKVSLPDGRVVAGRIVGADPDTDLAVIRASADGLKPITFGRSEQLRIGDVVLAIGNPFSVGQTVTMGIVSAVGREIPSASPFAGFIQTDAAINPGNSGGALVDADGNLVGINTLIFSRSGGYQGIGFAIPVATARKVMEEIIETGAVTRGYLGVEIGNITSDLADSLGLRSTRGAIIGSVAGASPAERAGLRPGDVLLQVDGKSIDDMSSALAAISGLPPGKAVSVRVQRAGREVTLAVTVGRRRSSSPG